MKTISLGIPALRDSYSWGVLTPAAVMREVYERIRGASECSTWITLIPEEGTVRRAEALGGFNVGLPLYGIPFATQDNIDLAGVPTTAACPEFADTPDQSAVVVARLMAAGAIPIGKINPDRFATGLAGTRSPDGACSSSGSAVAVAGTLVSFALGSESVGAGRIPAAFNGIIGLKATRGAISNTGVVLACRTLDCVSIFSHSCAEAKLVLDCVSGYDSGDPYSRREGQRKAWPPESFLFGVPAAELLDFSGDDSAPALFEHAACALEQLGGKRVRFDFGIFQEAARLAAMHPVTGQTNPNADSLTAVDAFRAAYRVAELTRDAEEAFHSMDFMLLPAAGNCYANLNYYTGFVNLLDLASVAVPAGARANGMPFGVTLIGPAWSDEALLGVADRLHLTFGPANARKLTLPYCPSGWVPLAVCGAHLSGQPLNHQLLGMGAFLIEKTSTAANYRLYALPGTVPSNPGLVRAKDGGPGGVIEVEVWAIPEDRFGGFVAAVPPPLTIGTCTLAGGRKVKAFLCEPAAIETSQDITGLGSWRRYVSR